MAELTTSQSYDLDRPLGRQHSRSSSQVATLASLTIAANKSLPPSPTRSQSGNQSPRYSISGLTGESSSSSSNLNNVNVSGGRESPVYFSRSNTPEPPPPPWVTTSNGMNSISMTGIESKTGRLSLDGTSSNTSNSNSNSGGASMRNTLSASSRLSSSSSSFRPHLPEDLNLSSLSHSNYLGTEPHPLSSPSRFPSRVPSPTETSSPTAFTSTSTSNNNQTNQNPTNLAQLIQQKRRQASAPYFASAKSSSLFSPGAGFGISSIEPLSITTSSSSNMNGMAIERIDFAGAWGAGMNGGGIGGGGVGEGGRRARSRQATRAGSLVMNDETGGMVMTPTTAEWKSLGGQLTELADIRARDEAKIDAGLPIDAAIIRSPVLQHKSNTSSGANSISTASSSSSISLTELSKSSTSIHEALVSSRPASPTVRPQPRPISILNSNNLQTRERSNSDPTTTSPIISESSSLSKYTTSFSYQTSHTGFTHTSSRSFDSKKISPLIPPLTSPSTSPFLPSHKSLTNSSDYSPRPNLSSNSLSSTTGSPIPFTFGSNSHPYSHSNSTHSPSHLSHHYSTSSLDYSPPLETPEIEIPLSLIPVELSWTTTLGPVDPRRYSAFTGMRTIRDFLVLEEAGKGAYGTVCKAREKGVDGLGIGPELVIKYIIKQRILADCWKKHKILGPIPIEVHVLDHLRRVPYSPRLPGSGRPSRRQKNNLKGLGFGLDNRRESGGRNVNSNGLNSSTGSSSNSGGVTMMTGHPNICGMLDFFEDGEFYYLVMPQAGTDPDSPLAPRGQDLFEHVDANADGLPPSSIKRILSQIADAIAFLHQHGIVHRDIKDENVVLDHLGNARLIDFGSAAYVKEGKRFDTFSGTLDFAAPEVLRGCRYGGKETDVWAIGVLAYVITIGECPFWSPEEAMLGLSPGSRAEQALLSKCSTSTPSIFSLSPSSPISITSSSENNEINVLDEGSGKIEDAVDLVMRCLEVDPDDRPSAELILEHRFICGKEGWFGTRGWEKEEEECEDDKMEVELVV